MNLSEFSKLAFFKVGKYEFINENICDFREIPRPHFCMGLIMKGTAFFTENGGEKITVEPGDIIFVPITSRYISEWIGNPDILYISMHFAFEPGGGISEQEGFKVQKLRLESFDRLKKIYEYVYEKHTSEDLSEKFYVLGKFFGLLGEILPQLEKEKTLEHDKRLDEAINFIRLNSEKELSVSYLAKICNMSVSNFYLRFKKYTGMTPIEYANGVRIGCAMRLLKADRTLPIEEISELTGFYSAAYFRRVFKKITGITPREYRSRKIEM